MRAKTIKRAQYKREKLAEKEAHRSIRNIMFAGLLVCALSTIGVWQTRQPRGYCYVHAPIPVEHLDRRVQLTQGQLMTWWEDGMFNCGTKTWENVWFTPQNETARDMFQSVPLPDTPPGEMATFFFNSYVPEDYELGEYNLVFRLEVDGMKFGDQYTFPIEVVAPDE